MYHLHIGWVNRTHADSAARRFEYISRTGRYRKRPDKVRQIYSGCMPQWAEGPNAAAYWQGADNPLNRINARVLYTIECALPLELTPEQQNQLAVDFMDEVSRLSVLDPAAVGLPFTLAVHEGYGTNPHFHALLSTSLNDRITRRPAQWFRRANPKKPEAGGARRCRRVGSHSWLLSVRKAWTTAANRALAAVALKPALDHRSHADRGIDEIPGVHIGPAPKALPNTGRALRVKFRNWTLEHLTKLDAWARSQVDKKQKEVDILLAAEVEEERVIQKIKAALASELMIFGETQIAAASTCALSVGSLEEALALKDRIEIEPLDRRVTRELGADWFLLQSGRDLWMWHPSKEGFIVAGSWFLATNSTDPELLDAFAKVAGLLKMPFSHGEAVATLESSVKSRLAAEEIFVQWGEDDIDVEVAPARTRSLRP